MLLLYLLLEYQFVFFLFELQQEGRRCKEKGIQLYQTHSYNQAIVLLGLAKELMPRSMAESQGQVQSYLASCHFSLRQYPEALEAGKEAYKIRPGRSLVCKINVYFYLMLFFQY